MVSGRLPEFHSEFSFLLELEVFCCMVSENPKASTSLPVESAAIVVRRMTLA